MCELELPCWSRWTCHFQARVQTLTGSQLVYILSKFSSFQRSGIQLFPPAPLSCQTGNLTLVVLWILAGEWHKRPGRLPKVAVVEAGSGWPPPYSCARITNSQLRKGYDPILSQLLGVALWIPQWCQSPGEARVPS